MSHLPNFLPFIPIQLDSILVIKRNKKSKSQPVVYLNHLLYQYASLIHHKCLKIFFKHYFVKVPLVF